MVYLDYNATTPLDKKVLQAMMPYLTNLYGNPSSPYELGEKSKAAIENSRKIIASYLKVNTENIFFTNSASEANNIILQSCMHQDFEIISTKIEHSSVIKCLSNSLFTDCPRYVAIDRFGNPSLKHLEILLANSKFTRKLVAIMTANNEIGTISNIPDIASLCKKYNALLFTDAVQALGKCDLNIEHVDFMSFSAHKIYGPKGVGALYVKEPEFLEPISHGGYQNTFVSGTENVANIVGFGKAVELLKEDDLGEIRSMRDILFNNIKSHVPDIILNGPGLQENRLINNINISIPGVPSEAIILSLDDVMVSGASACTSGSGEIIPSYVLKEINCGDPECSIRMSVGRFTTSFDISYASKQIVELINNIRSG